MRRLPYFLSFLLAGLLIVSMCLAASAATIKDLDQSRTYRVGQISILGNQALSSSELLQQMSTHERPLYQVWKKRPVFDSDKFKADLDRLRQFCRSQGFYEAQVSYDLKISGDLVDAQILLVENKPVKIQQVYIYLDGYPIARGQLPYNRISLRSGELFTQSSYQGAEQDLLNFYRGASYANASVTRKAQVNLSKHAARIWYFVEPGEKAVFGTTTVDGTEHIDPEIATREITYKPGEPFSPSKIEQSRENILKLGLFALVRFDPQLRGNHQQVVPIKLVVKERPKHDIRIGGGYNTQSQFIADIEWSDRNWLGGGRQLSLLARYSNINSAVAAILRQPYLFGSRWSTGYLAFREDILLVPPFTLFATRILPLLEYDFDSTLKGYIGYRLEYAKVTSIDQSVITALGGIKKSGFLFGPEGGMILNTTDDPYYPTEGNIFTVDVMQGGAIWGGDYDFYRFVVQEKHYQQLPWNTVLATRLKLGFADSIGSRINYPIFERFFAGGEGSVRGFGYWRLGPKSRDNVPLGGLTAIEGSIELRRKIWDKLGGAIFLDFGQLSTQPYHVPIGSLEFAAGPALSYATPVGPVRIDLGIPFKKPRGDQQWQIYFSIGQYF